MSKLLEKIQQIIDMLKAGQFVEGIGQFYADDVVKKNQPARLLRTGPRWSSTKRMS